MSKNPSAKQHPGTLGQELKRLATTLQQLVDCLLNKVFALTLNAARARGSMLVLLFLAAVFLINLAVRPWAEWQTYFRDLFTYLLQENSRQVAPQEAQAVFLNLVWKIISPTLQYLPLLIAPFYLALHVASIYLADIFELEKIGTARRFIMQASLGGTYDTIRIGEGEILEKYRDHPIIQIGGPGYVMVELDSAALFEKPDGRPHVIGPTLEKKSPSEKLKRSNIFSRSKAAEVASTNIFRTGSKVPLEGFERFRKAVCLKDHFTESIRVSDRSLDGIRVEARDVRLVFSVWRGDDEQARTPTLERPYPFDEQAIETLVYRRSCSVPRDNGGASKRGPWTNAIKSLIRNKLRGFINKYELSEFLASTGEPEINELGQLEKQTNMTGDKKTPSFHSRDELTNLFRRFAKDFTKQAKKRGVELHWIGVGTWRTPKEIIPKRHREAWCISRDNVVRKTEEELKKVQTEASLQELLRLVQEVPLGAFRYCMEHEFKDDKTLRALLLAYRGQLRDAREKFRDGSSRGFSPAVEMAIKHVENVTAHWVSPTSPEETGP